MSSPTHKTQPLYIDVPFATGHEATLHNLTFWSSSEKQQRPNWSHDNVVNSSGRQQRSDANQLLVVFHTFLILPFALIHTTGLNWFELDWTGLNLLFYSHSYKCLCETQRLHFPGCYKPSRWHFYTWTINVKPSICTYFIFELLHFWTKLTEVSEVVCNFKYKITFCLCQI